MKTKYEQLVDSIHSRDTKTTILLSVYMVVALGLSVFHIYTAAFGLLTGWQQRAIHLVFALLLAFVIPFISQKKGEKHHSLKQALNLVGLIATVAFAVFVLMNWPAIQMREGRPISIDVTMFWILLCLLLIATKKYLGWPLPIIAVCFLLYAYLGPYMPGVLRHAGFSTQKIVDQLFVTTSGIFGSALQASSVFIAIFIIFGNFMLQTKVGDYFIVFATAVAGRFRGGPVKAAVVASALMGTIHGSGPGNVATVGSFTIPLMKRVGFSSEFAAGVEAAAGTGGIIMPPIMGAAAFILAETAKIPYRRVALAAAIPAVMYFLCLLIMVDLESVKLDLKGMSKEELPSKKEVLQKSYLLTPLVAIITFLFIGIPPVKTGLYAIVITVVLSFVKKETRLDLNKVVTALESGGKEIVSIALACATAGIVSGLVSLTGLGIKMSYLISGVAQGNLLIALIMTMLVAIILGMGIPVTASYILVAATASQILTGMGVSVLATHMFMFYYASLSSITPPVAITSYTAAGIAGADHFKTSIEAVKLALSAFVVPFMFVYTPQLLFQGSLGEIVYATITALIGIGCFSIAIHGNHMKGKCNIISRLLLLGATGCLVLYGWQTDLIGAACLIAAYLCDKIFNGHRDHKFVS